MEMQKKSRAYAGRKTMCRRVLSSGAVLACVAALSVPSQAAAQTVLVYDGSTSLVREPTTVTDSIYTSSLMSFVVPDSFVGATVERTTYSGDKNGLQGRVTFKTGVHPKINMVIFDVYDSMENAELDYERDSALELTNIPYPQTYDYEMEAASDRKLKNKCFHAAIDPTGTSQDMVCQVWEQSTQTVVKIVLSAVPLRNADDLDWAKREAFDMIRIARETLNHTVYTSISVVNY